VHRDIKPENILVVVGVKDEVVYLKIADFGVACQINAEECDNHGIGTLGYMAPEIIDENSNYD